MVNYVISHAIVPPKKRNISGVIDSVKSPQRPLHDDEGPVRQLRGAEDDRRVGAEPAQGPDAQDPPLRGVATQVHLWQAHLGQTGEVLHEEQRPRSHRRPHQRNPVGTPRQSKLSHSWGKKSASAKHLICIRTFKS